MKKQLLLFILVLFCSTSPHAQNSIWNSPAAYLAQKPPSDTPEIFAPQLLMRKDTFAFDRVAFSDDGKEFYYPSNTTWFDGKNGKIRCFRYNGTQWEGPFVLNEHYYAPTFSIDNNSLYFLGGKKDSLHALVWQSKRTANGWTEPEIYLQKTYGLYDFMPTRSGTCYVGSNAQQGNLRQFASYDICTLRFSGNDTTVQSLGVPVNTPGFDGDFFVAKDESYLIVSAKETPTFECELYITYHKPDGTWTNPKSLGPLINDGVAHRWGEYVSPDGKYLFYARGTSPKDCHIYWVRFDGLLEQLRHTNFEPYVKHAVTDQAVEAGRSFAIDIPKDCFIDDDGNNTLRYSAGLQDGRPLPDGLQFNAARQQFTGKLSSPGTYTIQLTATDTAQATASCSFLLTVK